MFIAAQIATENNQNMAVVSAIANGTIPLGLLGSYCIYKEQLTLVQVLGSLACLIGILTLTLSVLLFGTEEQPQALDADSLSVVVDTEAS